MTFSEVPGWIWKTVVGVAALAGLAVSFFTIQQFFESRLEKEFTAQSEKIITEIQNKSETIMDFQKENGLKVDGKVGPKTWEKLKTYLE